MRGHVCGTTLSRALLRVRRNAWVHTRRGGLRLGDRRGGAPEALPGTRAVWLPDAAGHDNACLGPASVYWCWGSTRYPGIFKRSGTRIRGEDRGLGRRVRPRPTHHRDMPERRAVYSVFVFSTAALKAL